MTHIDNCGDDRDDGDEYEKEKQEDDNLNNNSNNINNNSNNINNNSNNINNNNNNNISRKSGRRWSALPVPCLSRL